LSQKISKRDGQNKNIDGITSTSNLKITEIKYDADGVEIMRVERKVEDMIDVKHKDIC
jgi:hypothetical protein